LTKQNGESAREEFQIIVPSDFWRDLKKDYWNVCNVKVCKQKQFKSRTIEKSSHITTALWNCSLDDGTTKIIEGSSRTTSHVQSRVMGGKIQSTPAQSQQSSMH
jgi:hypothetical protein